MKGDRTYIVSVEDKETGACIAAGSLVGSRQYIHGLVAIARFIDDNDLPRIIRVMPPERYPMKLFEGQEIKDLARAARYAQINIGE